MLFSLNNTFNLQKKNENEEIEECRMVGRGTIRSHSHFKERVVGSVNCAVCTHWMGR
jgi:hypothetical protein